MKFLRPAFYLLFTFFALMFSTQQVAAAKKEKLKVKHDSSAIQQRQPLQEEQDDVYSDDDYNYDKSAGPEEPTWWDRFLSWLLDSLFGSEEGSTFWRIFFIILAALIMVGIIFLLTKTSIRSIFFSKPAESEVGDGSTFDINIHELDFREQISAALKKGDYRLAVRLQYLFILKKLSDKGLIQWRMDRTNYDYYLHLAGNRHQEEFRQVSLIYDYCWYGDFQVAETDYRRAEDMFNQFSSTVAGA